MNTRTESESRIPFGSEAARNREAFEAEMAAQILRMNRHKAKPARFLNTDNVVGMLGEFPELTKAVREGDLGTVSTLCARLYFLNSDAKARP
jgi:hypothetical protein